MEACAMATGASSIGVGSLIEPLEGRQLLSTTLVAGLLTVTGTASADIIQLDLSGSYVIVTEGRTSRRFTSASITRVSINTLAGNDFISLGRVTAPATIFGGDGNDSIAGGAGNDSIDGGNGNDGIEGRDGNDTITGAANNDTLRGNNGNDSLDGGANNDLLLGGDGANTIAGGLGT